eukprot:g12986.t1
MAGRFGLVEAQFDLGNGYSFGKGVNQDYAQAVYCPEFGRIHMYEFGATLILPQCLVIKPARPCPRLPGPKFCMGSKFSPIILYRPVQNLFSSNFAFFATKRTLEFLLPVSILFSFSYSSARIRSYQIFPVVKPSKDSICVPTVPPLSQYLTLQSVRALKAKLQYTSALPDPKSSSHIVLKYRSQNLMYTILYYTILYYIILYYTILYYTITILYYTILYYSIYTILYYTILYYTILYYTTLHYTTLYYTILYYTILYYTILYYTILYTILYYILYYTILYYNILYYTILYYILYYCTILYYTIL